jgi:hypothetical protein
MALNGAYLGRKWRYLERIMAGAARGRVCAFIQAWRGFHGAVRAADGAGRYGLAVCALKAGPDKTIRSQSYVNLQNSGRDIQISRASFSLFP